MPLKRMPPPSTGPAAEELARRLAEEWQQPKEAGQPIIVVRPGRRGGGTQIVVVWDDWGDLPQQDRSEIIMDVFEQIHSDEEILDVIMAMGLTVREADRMEIPYK